MQTLFGIPLDTLMRVLLIATIAAAALVVIAALLKPILLKIGLRNVPRRRLRMLLIIFGLMLATTFISFFNYGLIDDIISVGQGDLGLFPQDVYSEVQQGL